MTVRLKHVEKGASEALLRSFEARIQAMLPSDYRAFLARNNGATPELNEFDIPGENNSCGINEFLTLDEIQKKREVFSGRIPESMLPIAHAEGGNLVCIELATGDVFFWDHEMEHLNPFFRLAQNFGQFLQSLEPFDVSSLAQHPGRLTSYTIPPSTLEMLSGSEKQNYNLRQLEIMRDQISDFRSGAINRGQLAEALRDPLEKIYKPDLSWKAACQRYLSEVERDHSSSISAPISELEKLIDDARRQVKKKVEN